MRKALSLVFCITISLNYLTNSAKALSIGSPNLEDSAIPVAELNLREPVKPNIDKNKTTSDPATPESVSSFAAAPFKLQTSSAQLPGETRLRMSVESPISAGTAELGDNFKARVLDDFYLTGEFRKLIIPKNSWIRGKVQDVKKPRLLSRSGKLGIKLDMLITPQGEYVPLDADLVFMPGVVNKNGLLDPQTGFSDKAVAPTNSLLSTTTGKVVSAATVGVPVLGTLLGGSVIALFSHGDAASVYRGQELQIILTRNISLGL